MTGDTTARQRTSVHREILRLSVPALGALVAEPLFLLADSAMVGHLGADPLAGLGLASAVLQTIVGLMVFLAYGTTPRVARRLGAGDERGAIAAGADGLWFALMLGITIAVVGAIATPWVIHSFGATPSVAEHASSYLAISMAGVPAMLLVFAAAGLLRGLQDTRTPLIVAGFGFGANIALNAVLIYGLNLGIAGSAIGTVIAQWGMVGAYLVVILALARRTGASLTPNWSGIRGSISGDLWLFVRTASLRAAMLVTVWVAARFGSAELAALQVVMTIFMTAAFALDALAIAAQALIGRSLGAHDFARTREVVRTCLIWGIACGLVLAAILAATSPIAPYLFTGDSEVIAILPPALLVVAVGAPLGGWVFALDGILIGASDMRYLAVSGLVNLAAFVPLALAVAVWAPAGTVGLTWLTAAFALGFLAARAVTLTWRARGTAWMRGGTA